MTMCASERCPSNILLAGKTRNNTSFAESAAKAKEPNCQLWKRVAPIVADAFSALLVVFLLD